MEQHSPDEERLQAAYRQIGEGGMLRLVAAFYRRVRNDDLIGPMYPPQDWAGAEERLADFLIQRLGGPPRYSQRRGHPRLRMRHMPFAIDSAARDRWMELMTSAMTEVETPEPAASALREFLGPVATFLINRYPLQRPEEGTAL